MTAPDDQPATTAPENQPAGIGRRPADPGTARAAILARLRATDPPSGRVEVAVPRDYSDPTGAGTGQPAVSGATPPAGEELVELLTDRLVDYRATVRRCTAAGLAATLGELLSGVPVLAVPPGLPAGWLTAYPGEVGRDGTPRPLTVADLDRPGLAVLTGCAVAVAQTGTLILAAEPDQGRRLLTLVPDHHLCVVRTGQIVAGLPAALRRLTDPTRPLTLVSGPSATSDIELNRVEGVHGPRRLDVVLVDEAAQP
nr:LUD domain-containing protein [Micromonospora sp. DSM 115978]